MRNNKIYNAYLLNFNPKNKDTNSEGYDFSNIKIGETDNLDCKNKDGRFKPNFKDININDKIFVSVNSEVRYTAEVTYKNDEYITIRKKQELSSPIKLDIRKLNLGAIQFGQALIGLDTDQIQQIERLINGNNIQSSMNEDSKSENVNCIQCIYYGTPGSGKSYTVEKLVKGTYPDKEERDEYVFRTIFHPDSDYSSFVGCYKPIVNKSKQNGNISYEFVPQTFTKSYVKAWRNTDKQVYLIIEEINRGNCAQIFGDIFQLLDRTNGISEYPIDADNDLKDYIENALGANHKGIANGKLTLPANLNIIATMNTSDQSLFPMDSAFKRRWSWKCVPINYENHDSEKFTISINNKQYKWHDFLKTVNEKIKEVTDSEDKQMGNFFITQNIKEDQFIDKVMFYLWNDVCKEEFHTTNNFFRYENGTKEFSFNELFGTNATTILSKFMEHIGVEEIKTNEVTEIQ